MDEANVDRDGPRIDAAATAPAEKAIQQADRVKINVPVPFSASTGEKPGEATADDHAYFYWVPLGEAADPTELKAETVELSKTVKAPYPVGKRTK